MGYGNFDFQSFCAQCPKGSTHCCTKKNNLVLVLEEEKEGLRELYSELCSNDKLKQHVPLEELFQEDKAQGNLVPMTLISETMIDYDDNLVEVDRCPFFEDNKCSIHENKPMDCKVWPIAKFEQDNVHIDIDCSAINDAEVIPKETIDESVSAIESKLTDEEKLIYYELSKLSFSLKPIPIKLWSDFQKFKNQYKPLFDERISNINKAINIARPKLLSIDYRSDQVLTVTKWLIGIFFVLILGSAINQIVFNVSVPEFYSRLSFLNSLTDSGTDLPLQVFIIGLLFTMFIADTYRIIVPLPWIIKDYDKNPFIDEEEDDNFDGNNLPRYQVTKLIIIGALSFLLLNVIAVRFILEPRHYFFIYSMVLALDLSWYFITRNLYKWATFTFKVTLPFILLFAFSSVTLKLFSLLLNRDVNLLYLLIAHVATLIILLLFANKYPNINYRSLRPFVSYFRFFKPNIELNELEELIKKELKIDTKGLEQELLEAAKKKGGDFNKIIEYIRDQEERCEVVKNQKLDELKRLNQYSEKCEQSIEANERELAKKKLFRLISVSDFAICFGVSVFLFFSHSSFDWCSIETENYLLITALLMHCIVICFELWYNKGFVDYLRYLYLSPSSKSEIDD